MNIDSGSENPQEMVFQKPHIKTVYAEMSLSIY